MLKTQAIVEKIWLSTYPAPQAVSHPIFAESRVHQRSSGNPYPNQVVCDVNRDTPEMKEYTVVRLENDYLRLLLLPEIGGRIFEAYDKVNDYYFFYRQHVIKPALIGLLGSWISGGVEFNWPCHHRPSTFMPTDYSIEYDERGAATVWMSEHEPLDRMKGMVGVRLAPDEAAIDTLIRVYNRTPERHSFLWWENAAVPVNKEYRIFFPHDVRYVQFHYRKNVTTYPLASGLYNGIRIGDNSVDIRLHRNTIQPTSYFCGETKREFFGGYDAGKQRGVVHVANRHLSIGKKMFTWAYNQLSHSWEHALTDTDGEYAELMAGSYSSNQPDFGWLEPYETKTFSQRWYPIGAMGVPDAAQQGAAVRFAENGVWLQTTKPLKNGMLLCGGETHNVSAQPCQPVFVPCNPSTEVILKTAEGQVLLADKLMPADDTIIPDPLPALPPLGEGGSAQDLYIQGLHVDQYRDPAVRPDAYYREALCRDPKHIPTLLAMAEYEWKNGRDEMALEYAQRCRAEMTVWNYHPESGRLDYTLGLILEGLGREDDAYDAYYRAYWNLDARSRAMTRIAALDGRRQNYEKMLEHAREALRTDSDNALARAALVVALRHQGKDGEAAAALETSLAMDAQDMLARTLHSYYEGDVRFINGRKSDPCQLALDVAFDLLQLGEKECAVALLDALNEPVVMTAYTRAAILGLDTDGGKAAMQQAETLDFGHTYPTRAGEEAVLRAVIKHAPQSGKAVFGLGCLCYHHRNYQEAYDLWKSLCQREPENSQAMRCLGMVCYSHMERKHEGYALLRRALALNPSDAHLTWETAHVMIKLALPPQEVIDFLNASPVCDARDDLAVEHARALNLAGKWTEVLELMTKRTFIPCEGGEHSVAEQYMFACHALGRAALHNGNVEKALAHFRAAQVLPDNLGAGMWNEVLLVPHRLYEGICLKQMGHEEEAFACLRFVCDYPQDSFSDMHLPELPCYKAMAHRQLGQEAAAIEYAARHYQKWEKARKTRDPGFFKTTPFFISFLEDAPTMRTWACNYHCGFALKNLQGKEQESKRLLAGSDPANLYATLMAKFDL